MNNKEHENDELSTEKFYIRDLLNNWPRSIWKKKDVRPGRGAGCGLGTTAGKGTKGQSARGHKQKLGFEGGQTTVVRRLPKVGGSFIDKKIYTINSLDLVSKIKSPISVDEARKILNIPHYYKIIRIVGPHKNLLKK
jgi:large subunit ribosomal protein L15